MFMLYFDVFVIYIKGDIILCSHIFSDIGQLFFNFLINFGVHIYCKLKTEYEYAFLSFPIVEHSIVSCIFCDTCMCATVSYC